MKVFTSGVDKTTRVWEARTGRELHRHKGRAAAFSPDGKTAASMAEAAKGVRLWDTVSGKDLHELPGGAGFTRDISVNSCTFSADGKYVAAWGGMKEPIRVWDTATGRERRPIPVDWLLGALALSPNGQQVAAAEYPGQNKPICLWDIDSGREIKVLPEKFAGANALAIAPDGTILAIAGSSPGVRLWNVRTGKQCCQLDVPLGFVRQVAFAPDGKSLASVGGYDGSVYLWETTTGKMRRRFDGHVGGLSTVAFSPDGKLLVTGGDDGTPLVWDVMDIAPFHQGRQAKPTAEMLADCWQALGAEDVEKAWRAARTLVAGSEQAVSLLRERLAAQAVAAERAARWIAQLDDDSFANRERASRELAALGKSAIPALRKTQANAPSAEVARRVKALLAKLDKPGLCSVELAGLRAVEVLEYLGTSEARQLLATLAKGAGDTRLTREARASLRRLEMRANKP
jgi:WD40 repeat protein